MPRLSAETKYRRLLVWLRQEFILRHSVTVRRKRMTTNATDCGECIFNSRHKRFVINIEKRQHNPLTIDSVLHEWAHALTWFGSDDDHHGPEWGLAYAKIYRRFLRWDYGRGTTTKQRGMNDG